MDKIKTIFIAGPTASGKTSLGVELAGIFNGEVVSADSMQIYKYMDIATAKPTIDETNGIPHYMTDFLDPAESYSVAQYKSDAMKCIKVIASKGKIPIVVGGTGLYIDTLIHNTEFIDIKTDEKLREELYRKCSELGCEKLWNELNSIDSTAASNIHKNNSKKIIRALEIYYQTGKTLTQQNEISRLNESEIEPIMLVLDAHNRNYLYSRINRRVDLMVENGLIEEAKGFFEKYGSGTAVQAIGYKELKPYFDNEKTLEECLEILKMQTRRYAKRQLTWFRRYSDALWLYIDENDSLISSAVEYIKERGII